MSNLTMCFVDFAKVLLNVCGTIIESLWISCEELF